MSFYLLISVTVPVLFLLSFPFSFPCLFLLSLYLFPFNKKRPGWLKPNLFSFSLFLVFVSFSVPFPGPFSVFCPFISFLFPFISVFFPVSSFPFFSLFLSLCVTWPSSEATNEIHWPVTHKDERKKRNKKVEIVSYLLISSIEGAQDGKRKAGPGAATGNDFYFPLLLFLRILWAKHISEGSSARILSLFPHTKNRIKFILGGEKGKRSNPHTVCAPKAP